MKRIIPVVAIVVFFVTHTALAVDKDKKDEKTNPAQTISELQTQIEKILRDTHTPGVSIAIVHRDGPEWIAGVGQADVASGRAATADTLFRIGSTSKGFASLSILMLADQGRLSLEDPVHTLAPDVWFENAWEATDPVRVVHLLEHTTGWDDIHLRDYAKDWPGTKGVKEGLDYDHHSRVSRWRPGTRMAYCNSGPAVAAYIVERITGQRFEEFVEQNLFEPIRMKTATYFQPAAGTATTLYHDDGKTPYRYWNILLRPAGSINASANDMAAYLEFYLNRGAVHGKQIVPAADIDRMESPTSTWAAWDGMKAGYGLSNYWSVKEGFVYHGHDGGVAGGFTDMAYMPDYGVGYFYSINSGSGDAFEKIGKAVRAYVTDKLQRPTLPAVASLPANASDYAGWYEPDSPRVEMSHFLERLAGLCWLHFRNGKLILSSLGDSEEFLPLERSQFRLVPKKYPPEPVATLELLTPNAEGLFIQAGFGNTMKRVPGWFAVGEIVVTIFVLLSILSVLLYAPFWIFGGLTRKRRRPAERAMRIWPLAAVLSLVAFVAIVILCRHDLIERMGNLTVWSALLFLSTIAFALATIASTIAWWRTPAEAARPSVRKFSAIVTAALVLAAAYLAYWGIIGLRTWA